MCYNLDMEYIELTKGKRTIVDDENFEYLNQWKWRISSHGYAIRRGKSRLGEPKQIFMHRIINKTPSTLITDHINKNKLDNRKINLRDADMRLNSINRLIQKNNTSGYKGLSWNKDVKKWETYIWSYGKKFLLGYFKDKNLAIKKRKKAEIIYHAI